MADSSFPKQAVTFDLPSGQVRLGAPGDAGIDNARSVIVPAAALGAIVEAAGEGRAEELGRALGAGIGARVRAHLGEALASSSIEAVLAAVATEVAIVGLGTLAIERWGRALVLNLTGAPFEGTSGDALLVAAIGALVAQATGRDAHAVPLARDGGSLRVLIANPRSAERVRAWLIDGVAWGDAIARLHATRTEEARA